MNERELRVLEIACEALEVTERRHHLAALIRKAIAAVRGIPAAAEPQTWRDISTFDGRDGFFLVQDGDEVYRAQWMQGQFRCDDGYTVHPQQWMPFAGGAR
jgi:hypothetical protein